MATLTAAIWGRYFWLYYSIFQKFLQGTPPHSIFPLIIIHYMPWKEEKDAQIHRLLMPGIADLRDYNKDAPPESLCQPSTDRSLVKPLQNSHAAEAARCLLHPVWSRSLAWIIIQQLQGFLQHCTTWIHTMFTAVKGSSELSCLTDQKPAVLLASDCYLHHHGDEVFAQFCRKQY